MVYEVREHKVRNVHWRPGPEKHRWMLSLRPWPPPRKVTSPRIRDCKLTGIAGCVGVEGLSKAWACPDCTIDQCERCGGKDEAGQDWIMCSRCESKFHTRSMTYTSTTDLH